MAASGVGRTFQAVKQHIPMIKFKSPGYIAASAPVLSPTATPQPVPAVTSQQHEMTSTTLAASYMKPVGNTPRGTGISDQDLPQKYRRKPIDDDEIAYILRGGPE